ncbi:MAG: hypothetical protein RIQ34_1682 [Bacteroidota bacterium]
MPKKIPNFERMPNLSPIKLIGLLMLFVSMQATAQRNQLRLQKGAKGFYLEHKVAAKQSFFSLSRMYNVHPRFLADYNKLDYKRGLQIDQGIRIPLTDTNYERTQANGVPVYLKAVSDDVLTDMAQSAGIRPADMQCWNTYTGNEIKKGSSWIVGFLKTQELKDQQVKITCTQKSPTPQTVQTVQTVQAVPSNLPASSTFQSDYLEQIKKTPVSQQLNVMASVFKTSSGWQDGKYYLLIDNLIPGTIIKLINPANQKEVYAKVLGEMSRIKQNEGLDIRISNAAAAMLEVPENSKFNLQIHY